MAALTLEEARTSLVINKYELDIMVMRHPILFDAVAEALVEAISIRDKMKEEADTLYATKSKFYRAKEDKVTEGRIQMLIETDEEYQQMRQDYLESKKEADIWAALKESYIQRGNMLRELCGLYVSGYWASESLKTEKAPNDVIVQSNRKRLQDFKRRVT